ncbi:MAG: hypothetical protein HKN04_08535 [Rhodothermaceae bacterium]|nr:hypothetical protein [Rhodothermaceae bacterium]
MDPLSLLLHRLDTAYDHKAWHGPTLKGVLRGVDVAALDPLDLNRHSSNYTLGELIAGVAAHDLYHAGQIQLMKRLAAESTLAPYTG